MSQTVTVDVYVDGSLIGSAQANTDRQDLVGAFGNSAARYHGFSYSVPANASWRNGQGHSIAVRIRGASTDVMSSPKTVSGCSGGTTNPTTNPPNPPSGNCAFSEGQFLFNWYGEQIYAHYANGILYAAYQNPGEGFKPQSWMQATGFDPGKVSCFSVNNPLTSTPIPPVTNPPTTNPPSGNCAYSEGQFLLNWYGEQIYAHYFNGTLYAAYQDGNVGFKPRSWLSSTGYDASISACFATSDPHTTVVTPSTNSIPSAGNNFTGNFENADCNGVNGWVLNRNKTNQSTKFDIWINGWLVAANVMAVKSRQDVANANNILGYNAFGFNLALPQNYKVGITLTISIKYAGTSTDIPGSPKITTVCEKVTTNSDCDTHLAKIFPGSEIAQSTETARIGTTSIKLRTKSSRSISTLTSKLIPVKQGDTFLLNAYALIQTLPKHNLNPQIAKAMVGGIVAGLALAVPQNEIADQQHINQLVPTLGISTALIIPLVKSLVDNRLPNAGLESTFYNKSGHFLHRQQILISKAAYQDWQFLHIDGQAPQDGFAVIRLRNRSKTSVYFDDFHFQTVAKSVNTDSLTVAQNKISYLTNGFAEDVFVNEQSISQVSNYNDCGYHSYGAIIDTGGWGFGGDGIWLDVPVQVTAPSYTYSNGIIVITGGSVYQLNRQDQTNRFNQQL